MSHLGSRLSALVDGQLEPHEAEQAAAHVAACPECHDEVLAARAARRRLAAAAHVPVNPELTARLLALAAEGCVERPADRVPARAGASLPMPGTRPARLPSDCLTGQVVRERGPRRVLVGAAGVGIAAVTLVALGVQPAVAPSAHPAHALTVLGRASSPRTADAAAVVSWPGGTEQEAAGGIVTRATSAAEPALAQALRSGDDAVLTWMADEGWTVPSGLPAGYTVAAVQLGVDGTDALELDLAGPYGTIVVTERHGRLDDAAVVDAPRVALGDREVHLLSSAPWHGVWQSGDTVVSVVAQDRSVAVDELVTAYPDQGYDDRVSARIARGWAVLAGAWTP